MFDFYHHIYLSPHYDDAALSCGGAIHHQNRADEPVLVMTIFAAPPDPTDPLSPFAAQLHRQWGAPVDMVTARQAEDQAAMAVLGADYLRLRFTDCIYRGEVRTEAWFYTSNAHLFGRVHPEEVPLAGEIVDAVLELAPAHAGLTLYAPLGVGHHVDHQLTRAAAQQLQRLGYRLAYYEDYPYADPFYAGRYTHSLADTLAAQQAVNLTPRLIPLTEADFAAKIDSVRAYGSQLQILFDTETHMAERLRAFAGHTGNGQPAERVWLPVKSPSKITKAKS